MRAPAWILLAAVVGLLASRAGAADQDASNDTAAAFRRGEFHWHCGGPLLAPLDRPGDHFYSIKDPSVVYHRGRWHVFCTVRGQNRSHQIEYLSFPDWDQVDRAQRHLLEISPGFYCAPQVFYFRPHRKWYLIYQVIEQSRKPALQPAFSTTTDLADPKSWTPPVLLFARQPRTVKRWIDFWVICDQSKAHLFFTSNNGKMWRSETSLDAFPHGWSLPQVVLRADIFEAGHTYRLAGMDRYLTIVEAQAGGRRYYKAYLAKTLDGRWQPLADRPDKPFAGLANVSFTASKWCDSFSHGELLRSGCDERLEVDPANPRMLFQGVADGRRKGKPYGQIPWRLGLLVP